MFDLVFSSMMAFETIMLMMGAVISLGIGGLLISDYLYWSIKAARSSGKIVSLREGKGNSKKQSFYYPVIEYKNHCGEIKRVTSDAGSSHIRENTLGRTVTVLYFPDKEGKIRAQGNGWIMVMAGVVLLGVGGFLASLAVQSFEFGAPFFFIAGILAVYALFKLKGLVKPKEQKGVIEGFKSKRQEKLDSYPELTLQQIRDKQKQDQKFFALWKVFFLVAAIGCGSGAYFLGVGMYELERNGKRAMGRVVGMKESSGSDSVTYAPIVEFKTESGQKVKFTSDVSSSHPHHRRGDDVTILYDPAAPQKKAIIDEGLWNWFLSGCLMLAALGCFALFFGETLRSRKAL